MTGKKFFKACAAMLMACLLLLSPQYITENASATSISSLKQQQSKLQKEQAEVNKKLKTLKNDKSKKVEYKNALTEQVSNIQSQIDNLNSQISDLNSDIKEEEAKIADKQSDIDKNYTKLKGRLKAVYLTGEASNIEIVLNAKNIMDLSDKTELVRCITKHDTELINTLKGELQSIQSEKEDIESKKASVVSAKASYDQKQEELNERVSEVNEVISELSQNEAEANAENAKLAKERAAADAAIDSWYKAYYASQKKSTGSGSKNSGSGGYVSTGSFTWPVPSCTNITSGYGYRSLSGGEFHKGVDISRSGIYGAAIVAADSGKVIQAGWGNYGTGYGGYGNVVAIDHGGGYSTLYGHCSSVAVSKGQTVKKGQVIAYVGSTGQSTGPHLHFEVRVNGSTTNPMNYFK